VALTRARNKWDHRGAAIDEFRYRNVHSIFASIISRLSLGSLDEYTQ
jgi:hypothetical protein